MGMDIAMHLEVKRNFNSFPMWGRILQGRIAVHLSGRNLNSFLLWEEFVWKDSCCGRRGEIALHRGGRILRLIAPSLQFQIDGEG